MIATRSVRSPSLSFVAVCLLAIFIISCGDDDPPNGGGKQAERISAVNGIKYKGIMGSDSLVPILEFAALDTNGRGMANKWIHFSLLEGDGAILADSLQSDSSGLVKTGYTFDGALGHAILRAWSPAFDSAEVRMRANTLIPGPTGQGQYVLFSDSYRDALDFNGSPVVLTPDPRPDVGLFYADYESALGVVVMVIDADLDGRIDDTSSIHGVIVNSVYPFKTADSLGIGSSYADVISAWGQPDSVFRDSVIPPALTLRYDNPSRSWFFLDTVAANSPETLSTVFEIHLTSFVKSGPAPANSFGGQMPSRVREKQLQNSD